MPCGWGYSEKLTNLWFAAAKGSRVPANIRQIATMPD
jgi:hypothetical protein